MNRKNTLSTKQAMPIEQAIAKPSTFTVLPDETWLDKQDVMQMLHISSGTLQKWRNLKVITFTKVFGKIYYPKSEVIRLLQDNLVSA